MGQTVAGFELPEGTKIEDLDLWPPFVEWFKSEYGFEPNAKHHQEKELFEAWMAGAAWDFKQSIDGVTA